MQKLVLHIEGMSCGHCLNAVTKALSGLEGVRVDSVRIGRADVDYDPAKQSRESIVAAVEAAGYRAMAAA